ncbi:hypothetical protein MNBD_GAMMA12-386 [hydrothermal vent metagenome]|uniref:Lipoprotein n=1 Tax=hydrothermal vent metagenome TaxID=652676 RepID=A0A3B0ZCJ7_9ZZZZ
MKIMPWITVIMTMFFVLSCSSQQGDASDKASGQNKISKSKSLSPSKVLYKAQFSYTIFRNLKTNDFQSYSKRFITRSDLDYFFLMKLSNTIKKIKDISKVKLLKQKIVVARKKFPARRQARLKTLHNAFIAIRQHAIKNGVDWKTAEFKGYKLENGRHINKIATADMTITFVSNKKHYVFKIPRCQYARRGWIFSEPLRWIGLYK